MAITRHDKRYDSMCGTAAGACSAKPTESASCSASMLSWCSSGGVGRPVLYPLLFSLDACFHHKHETTAFVQVPPEFIGQNFSSFPFVTIPLSSNHRTNARHLRVLRATMYVSLVSFSPLISLYLCRLHLCLFISFTLPLLLPPPQYALAKTHIQAEQGIREERQGDVTHALRAARKRHRKRKRPVRVLHVLNVDALPCARGRVMGGSLGLFLPSCQHRSENRTEFQRSVFAP